MEKCSGCDILTDVLTNAFWIIIIYADMVCFFQLEGSMIIVAQNIMGSTRNDENGEPILKHGHRYGIACFFSNI